jgi:hypothetical protein
MYNPHRRGVCSSRMSFAICVGGARTSHHNLWRRRVAGVADLHDEVLPVRARDLLLGLQPRGAGLDLGAAIASHNPRRAWRSAHSERVLWEVQIATPARPCASGGDLAGLQHQQRAPHVAVRGLGDALRELVWPRGAVTSVGTR